MSRSHFSRNLLSTGRNRPETVCLNLLIKKAHYRTKFRYRWWFHSIFCAEFVFSKLFGEDDSQFDLLVLFNLTTRVAGFPVRSPWPSTTLKTTMTLENQHFFIGDTSSNSNGCFSIAMLVFGGVGFFPLPNGRNYTGNCGVKYDQVYLAISL